jgi:O-antigen/teichoic acid export membrane protein
MIPGAKLVLGTTAALAGLGSMGFAWAYAGAMILGGVTGLVFLVYSIPAAAGKAYDYGKKAILRAALPLMVVTGANVVYTSIDTLMVGYFDATGEVGIYRASWMVSRVTLVPLLAMAFLAMPTLSELHSKGDMKGVNKIYSLTVKWISLASLPVLTAFVSFPGLIMTTIFGEEYASGAAVLIILSSGFFTHCVMGNNEGLMISVGGEKRLMGISVVALFMNIVLNISLIPKFGGGGAAIATAATFMLMNIFMSFCLYRYHGIRIGLRYTSARIMWLFAPAIATYFVSTAHVTGSSLFLVLVAAIFAYAYLVLRLAVTEPEEKRVALHGARLIGVEGILKRIV